MFSLSEMKNELIKITIIFFLALLLAKSLNVAFTEPLSFDGSFNVQVSRSIISGLGYSTSYNGLQYYNSIVQTGPTVILPIAINFLFFGISFESAQLVNTFYLIGLAMAYVYYSRKCLNLRWEIVLVGLIVFIATPQIFNFGMGGYGEIPALFFFQLFLIFLNKWYLKRKKIYWISSAFFAGLSVLTKTVLFLFVPSIIVSAVYFCISHNVTIKVISRSAASWSLFFILPVASFESAKLVKLGFDGYMTLFNSTGKAILQQAGIISGFKDTVGIFNKIEIHLTWLSAYTGVSRWIILLGFVCFLLLTVILVLKRNHPYIPKELYTPDVTILILTTLSYFGWWLMITPTWKAWHRRIFNGTVLSAISIPIVLATLTEPIQPCQSMKRKSLYTVIVTIFLIGAFCWLCANSPLPLNSGDSKAKKSVLETARYVNSQLQPGVFYGYGWWQSPVISFASGLNFYDLAKLDPTELEEDETNRYFIADTYVNIYPGGVEEALGKFNSKLIYSNDGNDIYLIVGQK
jgi:hypothetical protein